MYNLFLTPFYRSSFSDFASKYGKEERFRGIEKMRDREGLFSDYVSDLRRKEKEESKSQKEKVCVSLCLSVGRGNKAWHLPSVQWDTSTTTHITSLAYMLLGWQLSRH